MKGKATVTIMAKAEIKKRGILGAFALRKKCEDLIENIRAISVKMLSINHKLCSKDGSDFRKIPKKIRSKMVLTRAKRIIRVKNLFSL